MKFKNLLLLNLVLLGISALPAHAIYLGKTASVDEEISRSTVLFLREVTYQGKIKHVSCTGTLIDEGLVLTAKHCYKFDPESKRAWIVFDQGISINQFFAAPEKASHASVESFSVSPTQDLAIVRFDTKRTPKRFKPINVSNTDTDYKMGSKVYVAGFGDTEKGSTTRDTPEILKKASMTITDIYSYGLHTTISKDEDRGWASYGDSGGPLYIQGENGEIRLIGVIIKMGSFEDNDGTNRSLKISPSKINELVYQ